MLTRKLTAPSHCYSSTGPWKICALILHLLQDTNCPVKERGMGGIFPTTTNPLVFNLCLYALWQTGLRRKSNETELLETILSEVPISTSHQNCFPKIIPQELPVNPASPDDKALAKCTDQPSLGRTSSEQVQKTHRTKIHSSKTLITKMLLYRL